MIKLDVRSNLKDTLLVNFAVLFVVLAMVGLCFPAITQHLFSAVLVVSFGEFAEAEPIAQAGLAFCIIAFVSIFVLVAFMALQVIGKFEKVTKWKWCVSLASLVFLAIAFGCVAGYVSDLQAEATMNKGVILGGGAILFFISGLVTIICATFVGVDFKKFFKKPEENKPEQESQESIETEN